MPPLDQGNRSQEGLVVPMPVVADADHQAGSRLELREPEEVGVDTEGDEPDPILGEAELFPQDGKLRGALRENEAGLSKGAGRDTGSRRDGMLGGSASQVDPMTTGGAERVASNASGMPVRSSQHRSTSAGIRGRCTRRCADSTHSCCPARLRTLRARRRTGSEADGWWTDKRQP